MSLTVRRWYLLFGPATRLDLLQSFQSEPELSELETFSFSCATVSIVLSLSCACELCRGFYRGHLSPIYECPFDFEFVTSGFGYKFKSVAFAAKKIESVFFFKKHLVSSVKFRTSLCSPNFKSLLIDTLQTLYEECWKLKSWKVFEKCSKLVCVLVGATKTLLDLRGSPRFRKVTTRVR